MSSSSPLSFTLVPLGLVTLSVESSTRASHRSPQGLEHMSFKTCSPPTSVVLERSQTAKLTGGYALSFPLARSRAASLAPPPPLLRIHHPRSPPSIQILPKAPSPRSPASNLPFVSDRTLRRRLDAVGKRAPASLAPDDTFRTVIEVDGEEFALHMVSQNAVFDVLGVFFGPATRRTASDGRGVPVSGGWPKDMSVPPAARSGFPWNSRLWPVKGSDRSAVLMESPDLRSNGTFE